MTLLAGCKTYAVHAVSSLLHEVNEKFEELLFSQDRLAPELPISLQTPDVDFQCYSLVRPRYWLLHQTRV